MSKRKKRRRPKTDQARSATAATTGSPADSETRLAEIATVGWMLTALASGAAEIVMLAAFVGAWLRPEAQTVVAVAWLICLIAAIIGAVSLVLAAVAIGSRREPAPRKVTVVALSIAILPWVLLAWRLLP